LPNLSPNEILLVLQRLEFLPGVCLDQLYQLFQHWSAQKDVISLSDFTPEEQHMLHTFNRSHLSTKNWKYFYFIRTLSQKCNVVKFIYVVLPNGEVRVEHEAITTATRQRLTHSELAQGCSVAAAGELIFICQQGKWSLAIINNGSGHYRPPAHLSLKTAEASIRPLLHLEIRSDRISLQNCLRAGMTLASGWETADLPAAYRTSFTDAAQNAETQELSFETHYHGRFFAPVASPAAVEGDVPLKYYHQLRTAKVRQ
jgi:hypothetical protein